VTPEAAGLAQFTAVNIETEDGERIVGWWTPPARDGGGVVLYLHGTPGALVDWAPWRLPSIQKAGLGALAIDYRGYGGSTGTPSEAGIDLDARAAFDFIRSKAPHSKIAIFGESFGTGVAVALATERPAAGLLLNAAFASELRLFGLSAPPVLPYRWLLRDQYNSEALISSVAAPVMIVHGTADDQVPIAEARRLFAAARQPKTMIEIEGAGHTTAFDRVAERAIGALVAWTAPNPQSAYAQ
jgi:fermentation-respiration switch protein FrsA (DUF1100 family)